MKNLFLSALLVLTVSFAFANNNVEGISTIDVEETFELTKTIESNIIEENAFGICIYSITTTITWSDGSSTSWTDTYTASANSEGQCQAIAQAHVDSLNKL